MVLLLFFFYCCSLDYLYIKTGLTKQGFLRFFGVFYVQLLLKSILDSQGFEENNRREIYCTTTLIMHKQEVDLSILVVS